MRIETSDFEKTATREELQEAIVFYKDNIQRLGRKYEEILLNEFPYLGTKKTHSYEIKYCSNCQEEHYLNNGDCNECGQLYWDNYTIYGNGID